MEAFDQIWESSRINSWSWAYPAVLWSGVCVLFGLSFLTSTRLRRSAKIIAILGLSFVAMECSAREIQEKWHIRREWAAEHSDQLTIAQSDALTVDGANLALGPLLYGRDALLLFVAVSLGLFLLRLAVVPRPHREERSITPATLPGCGINGASNL